MRIVILLAWFAVMALYLLTAPLLPDRVGDPGHDLPRIAYLAVMMGLCTFTLLVTGGGAVAWLARRFPLSVGIPYRMYWLAPERREASIARLLGLMDGTRLMVLALFAGVQVFSLWRSHPEWPQLPEWLWLAGIGVFVIVTLVQVLKVIRAFPAPSSR